MTRYVLDTNVVSEARKVRPYGAVVAWLGTLAPEQMLISAVTVGELQAGVELTQRQDPSKAREIESWLGMLESPFAIAPMDSACFREWARIMRRMSNAIDADAMIAATARVHGLTVATRNEKDFKHFAVTVVNPFKAGPFS